MSIPGATDTDVVSIYGGTAVNGDLRIRTGGGTDSVFIQDTRIGDGLGLPSEHLTIDTGTGADVVNLAGGVLTSEGVTILAGEGNDTVLIRGTDVGDGRGFRTEDMRIFTGTGADSLHFGTGGERVLVRGNLLVATSFGFETEVDTVRMSHTTVHKTLSVLTGSGDDWVTMDTITATRMSLWTGDGNDTAELVDRVRAGDMFIGMGNGNDVLDMTGVEANFLSADGGAGVDRLFTFKPGSVLRSNVVNLEVINPPRLPFELPPAEKGNLV
jgi:hypothetical protein